MKITITHPIVHDGTTYDRGVHDLPEELAKLFLSYVWAAEKYVEAAVAPAKAAEKLEKRK